MSDGWIGVDLDGTLAYYDGWHGPDHIGSPIDDMVKMVKEMIERGDDVRIFTARVSSSAETCAEVPIPTTERDVEGQRRLIEAWCALHLGKVLPVTCIKDYHMIRLYDDRCTQIIKNTGIPLINILSDDQKEAVRVFDCEAL